jgi:hypothetical protein
LNSKCDWSIHFIAKYFGERGGKSTKDPPQRTQRAQRAQNAWVQGTEIEKPAGEAGSFFFPSKFRIADWKNKTAGIGGVGVTDAHGSERS